MTVTKYTRLSSPYRCKWARCDRRAAGERQRDDTAGREAPLVLIEEHLTDTPLEPRFHQAFSSGFLVDNWKAENGFVTPPDGELTPVLKIQHFEAGGYEATVRMLDLNKIGRAMQRSARRGKREAPASMSPENRAKAGQRAKRRVRHLVKNMGATNLVTLTRREGPSTKDWTDAQWEAWENGGREEWEAEHGEFWTAEEWAKAWDKLRRALERVIGDFPYVGVLEQHRKGNFHLHLAWVGKVNLNLLRPLWWACCGGRGEGNVDSKYIKVSRGCHRSAVISRYISKYVTKHFEEEGRFNKKRYWASRQTMADVQRYILKSGDVGQSLADLIGWMDFKFGDRHNFFLFPDGSGWWWNFVPEIHASPPPF